VNAQLKNLIFTLCCLGFAVSALSALLTCPECSNPVSEFAAACPKCGAPDSIIKTASTKTNNPSVDTRTFIVRIETDIGSSFCPVLKQHGTAFIVFDELLMDGASKLEVFTTNDNTSVAYKSLEIADDRRLARLATSATNILSLPWPTEEVAGTSTGRSVSVVSSGLATNQVSLISTPRFGLELDQPLNSHVFTLSGSNAVSIAQHGSSQKCIGVSPATRWISVSPKAFREQTQLLRQAETGIPTEKRLEVIQSLQQTEWFSQDLRERATAVIKSFSTN
jgi:hypothetical protein